ncbi:hypothetical protein [Polaromonas sp. YR568]|uniref:hypothetical protein n=1 Tax=Polaromonas sp. YR568 TaxID=1855301 RepID=UPI001113938F|nr:hypothetical protein [Polaromonas sp. YR568]
MNPTLVFAYGALIFLATVVASIPFGFVQGFTKARGAPLTDRTLALLKFPEYVLEAVAVISVIANLGARYPEDLLLHAVLAVIVSFLITFVVEVRCRLMPLREFFLRIVIGLGVCVPIGLLIGSGINAGA